MQEKCSMWWKELFLDCVLHIQNVRFKADKKCVESMRKKWCWWIEGTTGGHRLVKRWAGGTEAMAEWNFTCPRLSLPAPSTWQLEAAWNWPSRSFFPEEPAFRRWTRMVGLTPGLLKVLLATVTGQHEFILLFKHLFLHVYFTCAANEFLKGVPTSRGQS